MSSGLSSTCHAAQSLSQEYEGKVCVVDNQRISVTPEAIGGRCDKCSGMQEKSASEIKEILEAEKLQASIYITVDTLKYLKRADVLHRCRGARTVLNLKPVLQIQGENWMHFQK